MIKFTPTDTSQNLAGQSIVSIWSIWRFAMEDYTVDIGGKSAEIICTWAMTSIAMFKKLDGGFLK